MTWLYPTQPWPARPSEVPVYDEMKRHEVQVLRKAGFSLRQLAKKAKVGLNTVLRLLEKVPSTSNERPHVGRPLVALRYADIARRILEETPDLPTVEVLRLIREKVYPGGKNPVYRLARQLRRIVTPPMVRFEGLCGEFSQNDFGSIHVEYLDRSKEVLHFYAARLKWSRWVYVQLVQNEQEEALVGVPISSFQSSAASPSAASSTTPRPS